MSAQQNSPAEAQSPAVSTSNQDCEDTSSQSSHSLIDIDSQPTSPSHSTSKLADDIDELTLQDLSSTSSSSSSSDEVTEEETEFFQDTPPIAADPAEIEEFSRLASELSLFAACIASTQFPSSDSSTLSQNTLSILTTTSLTDAGADAEKTPTQALSTSADLQRTEAQALIEQRKSELTRDLMELISDEEGPNKELILSIYRLLCDWRSVYDGLEKWRREIEGEKVRKMYNREME
ncbi:hypothetical protein WAI453_012311 [Rhynchosporium graminicola]